MTLNRRQITDYKPAQVNPNAGSERGVAIIEDSLQHNGAGRSLLADANGEMIAGSHTLEALVSAGFTEVLEIETDGTIPVVVKRRDLDITDPRARALQIADNRATQLGYVEDTEVIAALLGDIQAKDAGALKGTGYSQSEIQALLDSLPPEHQATFETDTALNRWDVPDALFPSDNVWDVPTLDSRLQAQALELPVTRWGKVARSSRMNGTYHFYVDDYKFDALWDDPSNVINSGCKAVIEPNFSTNVNMPRAVVLWGIYRKRWLARYWQGYGVKVWVDLNIETPFADLALLGVPKGWTAYANRGYGKDMQHLDTAYEWAATHADGHPIQYVVYGGGKAVSQYCKQRGWLYVMEDAHQTEGRNYG